MFYVKATINNQIEIKVDLYEDEIFTCCPGCGVEEVVDTEMLIHVLKKGDFSSTSIYCGDCTAFLSVIKNKSEGGSRNE